MSGFNNIIQRGKPINIKDEGITIASDIDTLNFVGSIVTPTVIGSEVTETFTVSGSGNSISSEEVPSGSGTVFTLANTPITGTLRVYRGGARQQEGVGNDFTLSGDTITLSEALNVSEKLICDYEY